MQAGMVLDEEGRARESFLGRGLSMRERSEKGMIAVG